MANEKRVVRFVWNADNGTSNEREFIAEDKGGGFVEGVEIGTFFNFTKVPLPQNLFVDKEKYPCYVINRVCRGHASIIHIYPFGPALEGYDPNRVITSQDNEFIRQRMQISQMRPALATAQYHVKSVSGDDHFQKRVLIDTANWGKADKNLRPVVVLDKHFKGAGVRND